MVVNLLDEAFEVLRELNLLELLNQHGRAELVGSVALDLIVKPDIDIHLYTSDMDLLGKVNEIYGALLEHPKVSEVRISDYRPNGVKIGVDQYDGEFRFWDIDIWVSDKLESIAFENTKTIQSKLTTQNRRTIIGIKQHYYKLGQLRNGMSHRIYQAVLDHNVSSLNEFERFLATTYRES